ncbi:MAG: hypothetical protein HQK49_04015 [Oligoflexia bacterium]|nr:hypothetical protein [Oligoflexia bacterium]
MSSTSIIYELKYEVKSFPLIFYWKKGLLTILVVLLVAIFTYLVLKSLLYAIFAILVILLPVVNFIFPSRLKFYSTYVIKEQLLLKTELNYNDFDDIILLEDGLFFYKEINNSKKGFSAFRNRSRNKSEYLYIFDNDLRNKIFNLIKENRK